MFSARRYMRDVLTRVPTMTNHQVKDVLLKPGPRRVKILRHAAYRAQSQPSSLGTGREAYFKRSQGGRRPMFFSTARMRCPISGDACGYALNAHRLREACLEAPVSGLQTITFFPNDRG